MESIKRKYGWTPELEDFLKYSHPQLMNEYSGSFIITKQGDKYYWHYRLGRRGKKRNKYLCPVEPKDKPKRSTSFQYACDILLRKLDSKFTTSTRDNRYLTAYMDRYLDTIKENNLHKASTKNVIIAAIKDFEKYCDAHKVKLNSVPTDEMKTIYKDYIQHLYHRGMARTTVKNYAQNARTFLEWLAKDKLIGGLQLFPSQPISIELQKALTQLIYGRKKPPVVKHFKKEDYEAIYKECYDYIRELWNGYCDGGGVIPKRKDESGHTIRSHHVMGMNLRYFLSFLQIRYGFRIGEILFAYRSNEAYHTFHQRHYPNEMASYFDKTREGWIIRILDSKNRDRNVPIPDTIRSYNPPPERIPYQTIEHNGKTYYDTELVDVIFNIFPQSHFTFPSTNNDGSQRRSINHYINQFKKHMVIGSRWDKYGIQSTHNLRSLFISYSIRYRDITPYDVSRITGHSIQTMERHYIRENMQSKFEMFQRRMTQYDLIKAGRKENLDN